MYSSKVGISIDNFVANYRRSGLIKWAAGIWFWFFYEFKLLSKS